MATIEGNGCDPLADHPVIPCADAPCRVKEAIDAMPRHDPNDPFYEDYGICDYGGA